MKLKTLLLAHAIAFLLTGAACAQEYLDLGALHLFSPFAAHDNTPAEFFPFPASFKPTSVGQGMYGKVSILPNGSILYSPGPHFPGQDSFTFTAFAAGNSYFGIDAGITGIIAVTDFTVVKGCYALTSVLYAGDTIYPPTFGLMTITSLGTFTARIPSVGAIVGVIDSNGESPRFNLSLSFENGNPFVDGFIDGGGNHMFPIGTVLSGKRIAPAGGYAGRYIVAIDQSSPGRLNITPNGLITVAIPNFAGTQYPLVLTGAFLGGGAFSLYDSSDDYGSAIFHQTPASIDFSGAFAADTYGPLTGLSITGRRISPIAGRNTLAFGVPWALAR